MMFLPLALILWTTLPDASEPAIDDARLVDVCFVDAQHGWVVGDRGVIWHTDDGGQQWRRQSSGVSCPLRTVWFCDENIGWAAGGPSSPYTHVSRGVLLSTTDGGQTWTLTPRLTLPGVRRLRFFDPRHGWLLGDRSAMYPSGVFTTEDGGRHWSPLPGGDGVAWSAADFLDLHTGALAGHDGWLGRIARGEIEAGRRDEFGLRHLTQLQGTPPSYGWLIGDGGTVRWTGDRGATWRPSPGALPRGIEQFDLAALAVRGPKCWAAGSPGSRVFFTADAGRTWNGFPTGSTTPLWALAMLDDQHGWAVGSLGVILATDDGGQTWRRQRIGDRQAALLVLLAESDETPFEWIARWSGDDGYRTVVETLCRRDVETPPRDDAPLADRLHEAVIAAGGSDTATAWQFPLRQSGLHVPSSQIVASWDAAGDGRGLERLQARLVRAIRTWRPIALATSATANPAENPPADLIRRAVLQAASDAADPSRFPEQIAEAGLAPWSVRNIFGLTSPGVRGAGELSTSQFLPRLGDTPADAAAWSHGLLDDRFRPSPSIVGLNCLAGPMVADRRDWLGELSLAPGGPARRELPPPKRENFELRSRTMQRRRHVQAILERAERLGASTESLLAQIDNLTSDLDEQSRGQILYQLADHYDRSGHWPLAADTFTALLRQCPNHPLTPLAAMWLLPYNASSEAAWRVEHGDGKKRFEQAVQLGQELERTRPDWFARPSIAFPLAAAYRALGQTPQAERLYRMQFDGGSRDGYSACARAEMRQTTDKPSLPCVRAQTPPRLDGRLDDPVWRQAKSAALRSAQHDDAQWPAEAMLAYDDEFLYLAVRCQNPPNEPPGSTSDDETKGPRPRDADLSSCDRVELLVDIDRDFITFDRLAADSRGWTNDACWNDPTWNPTWYVAVQRDRKTWTLEAAIPLAELTGQRPKPGESWAIGLQRIAPGIGFQSWTTPAAVAPPLPDGFGYLVFQ
ncbi:MAG: YCF48-related protein [Thermoguttaceae bacterium]